MPRILGAAPSAANAIMRIVLVLEVHRTQIDHEQEHEHDYEYKQRKTLLAEQNHL